MNRSGAGLTGTANVRFEKLVLVTPVIGQVDDPFTVTSILPLPLMKTGSLKKKVVGSMSVTCCLLRCQKMFFRAEATGI